MTIKQNLKRFFITSVLISCVTTVTTVGVFYSLFITKYISNENVLASFKSKYDGLVNEEKSAQNYLDEIENSSDEKSRNVVRVVTLEQDLLPIMNKASDVNPYFTFTLNKIELDPNYVNVAHIYIDLTLKDNDLDDAFYDIYGIILEKSFDSIKSNKIRELIKINSKQYKIVYKKDYV